MIDNIRSDCSRNPYSEEDIQKLIMICISHIINAEKFEITPVARDLLGFFLDEDPNAHGICCCRFILSTGYPIYTFGSDSVINQILDHNNIVL